MEHPRWRQLLNDPAQIDPRGVDLGVIADAGEQAYRFALNRWNTLREGHDRDAHAGIALILAEAFDDRRALENIARDWPEDFPEEFAWRTVLAPPTAAMREVFGPKVLGTLLAWRDADDDSEPPAKSGRAARVLYPIDEDDIYLQTRRAVVERAEDKDAAERLADDLLVAAAKAHPDHLQVRRTVLAYWGEEQPLDDVPTAEPAPGEAPASWDATCALIARTRYSQFADRVIAVATQDDYAWSGPDEDAAELVRALAESIGDTADAKLLQIAKARVPVSGLAVRSLAERRRRLAGAPPAMLAQVEVLLAKMLDLGIVVEEIGPHTRLALAQARNESESPLDAALAMAEALGRPTGAELAPEWSAFSSWLTDTKLPGPTPVPAASPQRRERGGGRGTFGRLFGR